MFGASQPLFADCLTKDGVFKERVRNLSSKGAFLATGRKFSIGDEIALTIPLVHTKAIIKATGQIIRLDPAGVGVEFRILFNY
jgi:Tfp pilus assembly protein PilZ